MAGIINYFSTVPDYHRLVLLIICLLLFGNFELLYSFKKNDQKLRHIFTNTKFMLPAAPIQIAIGYLIITTINFDLTNHMGILNWLPIKINPLITFVIGFILLDFFEYVYHLIMHKVKRLWMVHLVHHSDLNLTVSTTLREHPIETAVRLLFLVLWVFLTGICFWALIFRQFIQIVSNVFVHSNFRINEKTDKVVSLLFVTPNMHQIHHHYLQPYTDKNYGDVLSIWDRIFKTFTRANAADLEFGVDTYFNKKETTNFLTLLKIPFGKYRPSNKTIDENDV